jgi:hypothetical protein
VLLPGGFAVDAIGVVWCKIAVLISWNRVVRSALDVCTEEQ